ncbi:MAG TPA: polysaccharide deacetylase family protein [Candidatus Sumerlaeota bacterium]|nr:polysaccharide deacetylase family protein [Candidatus Sumerlaeota bacterium]
MSFEFSYGGVIRAPRDKKEMALIFTGGDFAEGANHVAEVLAEEKVPGSFFFTGDFLENPANRNAIRKLVHDGHYLGPHSYEHLLYCPWEDREKTLVTREQFMSDLVKNITALENFDVPRARITWWIPPYEWYNDDISNWSRELGLRLFNFTPGTLSHTDYTTDDAKNHRSCDTIWKSIFDYEEKQADGLNGFMLLTHVGAGDKRTDKFFLRLRALVRELRARGYDLKPVDELLANAPQQAPQ